MTYKCWSDDRSIHISGSCGSGGEAKVYPLASASPFDLRQCLAKIYNPPTDSKSHERRVKKLLHYYENRGKYSACGDIAAFPTDILYKGSKCEKNVVGFLMRRAEDSLILADTWNGTERQQLRDHKNFLTPYTIASNLALCIYKLHKLSVVPADLNESNFMVNKKTHAVIAIDTDSFQLLDWDQREILLCPVGKDEYRAPEVLKSQHKRKRVEIESNNFSLAIIIFQVLLGKHPFRVSNKISGSDYDQNYAVDNIRNGRFAYGKSFPGYTPAPENQAKYNKIDQEIREFFYKCFIDGHLHPEKRPSAEEWHLALQKVISTRSARPSFSSPTTQSRQRLSQQPTPIPAGQSSLPPRNGENRWISSLLKELITSSLIVVGVPIVALHIIPMLLAFESSLKSEAPQAQVPKQCGDPWSSGPNLWYRVSAENSYDNFMEIKEEICCNAIQTQSVPGVWVASYRSEEKANELVRQLGRKGIRAKVLAPVSVEAEKPSTLNQCGVSE